MIVGTAYFTLTFGILVGLLLLGWAVSREGSLPGVWRWVPLVVGLVWFPLEALTAVLPDGWGLLLAGASWTTAGYALWQAGQ